MLNRLHGRLHVKEATGFNVHCYDLLHAPAETAPFSLRPCI